MFATASISAGSQIVPLGEIVPENDTLIRRVRVTVPAKVNLFLSVRGVRDDGYHELVTILHSVGLRDTIEADLIGSAFAVDHPASRASMRLEFAHDGHQGVPGGDDNLVVQAADALMAKVGMGGGRERHFRASSPVTSINLAKRIPVAAGMAGGSADAAATLIALNRLWQCGLDDSDLRSIAAELGADVPFCVTGGTALATGTGTATARVLTRGEYHWVVGIDDRPLSTPEVYRAFDEYCEPSIVEPDAVLQALRTGDAEALGAALHNDLQAAAEHLRPDLAERRAALIGAGALGAIVSGSGPTIVGLAANAEDARRIAAEVADVFARVEVTTSPAGGPDLRGS
ncbi:MAG: 4-diphosphocytidyl-2-C-methyl-D-erythritol kinase [Glaciecola sp.]|jgi:4-diphosphocytidyl-2-C-methyl-D-erythritol kinase